jgi:hypothetical protein
LSRQEFIKTQRNKRQLSSTRSTFALIWGLKYINLCKPKVHPPDRIKKKKTQKGALHWKSRPPVFIGLNRMEVLALLLPHVGQRKFLAWDDQMGGSVDCSLVGSCCHEPCVNVNNLECDLLSTSEPWFLATMFPNSTLSPHKYLPVFSGDFCWGFNY